MIPFIRHIASVPGEHQPLSLLAEEGVDRSVLVQLAVRGVLGYGRATSSLLELGCAAGRACLLGAGVRACEIDVLLFCTNSGRSLEFVDDVGHRLLCALKLSGAYLHGVCFQNCGDGVLALRTAGALIRAGEAQRVLIVSADRICDAGVPRILHQAYVHSDGAVACLVDTRGPGRPIESSMIHHATGSTAHEEDPHDIEARLHDFIAAAGAWAARQPTGIGGTDLLVTHNINRIFNQRLAQGFGIRGEHVIGNFAAGHCLAADVLMNLAALLDPAASFAPTRIWVFAPTFRSFGVMAIGGASARVPL